MTDVPISLQGQSDRTVPCDLCLQLYHTANDPHDFDVAEDLSNWMCLRQLAAAINRRLLETERISQDCLLSAPSFARVWRSQVICAARAKKDDGAVAAGRLHGRRIAISLSALRSVAINLIRQAGFQFIPDARRLLSAFPDFGLSWLFDKPSLED